VAKSRKKPSDSYTRARFHNAIEFAVAGALFILCAMRAFGAPAPAGGAADLPPNIQSALTSGKTLDRLRAAEAVRDRAASAPSDALRAALKIETNPQVRYTLLQALAAQEGTGAVPDLAAALRADPEPIVRMVAAQSLIALDEPAATRALAAALAGDPDPAVRVAAAVSLGSRRRPEAAQALLKAAGHKDPEVRKHVAWALLRQPKTPETEKALNKLQRDPDRRVSDSVKAWRKKR